MTRKHYTAIVRILAEEAAEYAQENPDMDASGWNPYDGVTLRLADYFAGENPRFDRNKFMKVYRDGKKVPV